jgi:hypothetical protein
VEELLMECDACGDAFEPYFWIDGKDLVKLSRELWMRP